MASYDAFQKANNKGADQTGLRLCCLQTPKTSFLASRLIIIYIPALRKNAKCLSSIKFTMLMFLILPSTKVAHIVSFTAKL